MQSTFVHAQSVANTAVATLLREKMSDHEVNIVRTELETIAKAHGYRVVIDMSRVHLLASSGLGLLLSMNKVCRENKGKLALAGVRPDLLELLKLTKVHKLFTLADSPQDALKAIA